MWKADDLLHWTHFFSLNLRLFGLSSELDLLFCTGREDPFKKSQIIKEDLRKKRLMTLRFCLWMHFTRCLMSFLSSSESPNKFITWYKYSLIKGVAEKLFLFRMANKVYPRAPTFSPFVASERGSFTIWMKSLVYNTNGCTVFDSNGDVVYRVDNYSRKCKSEVFLMDLRGKVLFTIRKKRLQLFGRWDGYRCTGSDADGKPCFKVEKLCRMLMGDFSCRISAGLEKYWMVQMDGKTSFRIIDIHGSIMAEGKRKSSSSGVLLGDDVLALEVQPQTDHCLVMALIVVYGLITRQL